MKGFTLIELLVVIAILAILAVAVVLVINPAQLLKESRDVTRISDLNTLNNAISLYLADNATTSWNGTYTGGSLTATTTCTSGTTSPANGLCTLVNIYTTSGTGWVLGVPLTSISLGSPVGSLPKDPNNGATCLSTDTVSTCFYSFKTGTTMGKYKLMANMESTKYAASGTADVESNTEDGGNLAQWFEVGTDLTL